MSERDPRKERSRVTANRELDRITKKYLSGTIKDDGKSDALSYAVTQLEYSRNADISVDVDRWIHAIELATDLDNPDWNQLIKDIEFDAAGFIEEADTPDWEKYGHALLNLAESVVAD